MTPEPRSFRSRVPFAARLRDEDRDPGVSESGAFGPTTALVELDLVAHPFSRAGDIVRHSDLLGWLVSRQSAAPTHLLRRSDRGKGAAPCGAAPCREASADQLCQRNCCGLRADSWEIMTLTSAGPRKAIASCKATFKSFRVSINQPLPPKASIILS